MKSLLPVQLRVVADDASIGVTEGDAGGGKWNDSAEAPSQMGGLSSDVAERVCGSPIESRSQGILCGRGAHGPALMDARLRRRRATNKSLI